MFRELDTPGRKTRAKPSPRQTAARYSRKGGPSTSGSNSGTRSAVGSDGGMAAATEGCANKSAADAVGGAAAVGDAWQLNDAARRAAGELEGARGA